MRLLSHSQAAHSKRENQDFFACRRVNDAQLIALADGQGGNAGGALAARLAVETALNFLEGEITSLGADMLRLAISVADEAIESHADAGFSTLILICANDHQVIGASVGDSQVWHIGTDSVVELSEGQQKNPPLGSGAALGTTFQMAVRAGEQILAMSDGVFRFVDFARILRICREIGDGNVLPRLLKLQKPNANAELPDDWSAVLLRF